MFCTNCGAETDGATCPNCNTLIVATTEPKKKGLGGIFQNLKIVIPVLAVFLLAAAGGGFYTYQANAQVVKHTKLHVEALDQVDSYNSSASTFDDLAATARTSRDQCYYNWYCSASTYSKWIDLVNTDENLAETMRSSASEAQVTADAELVIVNKSIQERTTGFVLTGLFSTLLVASLVLFLVFRKKPQIK